MRPSVLALAVGLVLTVTACGAAHVDAKAPARAINTASKLDCQVEQQSVETALEAYYAVNLRYPTRLAELAPIFLHDDPTGPTVDPSVRVRGYDRTAGTVEPGTACS